MPLPDLNLLLALDVLIDECSAAAAPDEPERASDEPHPWAGSALRWVTRCWCVPAAVWRPRPALQLREQVRDVIEQAHRVFNAGREVDMRVLERTFSVRANDVFIGGFGGRLREIFRQQAPRAVLRFVPEGDTDDDAMAQGRIDLYISTAGMRPIPRCRTCSVPRSWRRARDHPLFDEEISAERFAACDHIAVSRRGLPRGPIDDDLATLGLQRRVALISPTFHGAIFAAAESDLILPQMPSVMLERIVSMRLPLRLFRCRSRCVPRPSCRPGIRGWTTMRAHQWLRRSIKTMCERVEDAHR